VTNTGTGLLGLIASYGAFILFVIVLVEEAGLPLPLPSDLMLLFSGSLVAQGRLNVELTFASVMVATVLGTAVLYSLARHGGRPLVQRHGHWIRLDEARLCRAEQRLRKRAIWRLTILRLIPGLRVYSTITAGVLAIPRTEATVAFALSGAAWAALWIGLGVVLGPQLPVAIAWLQRIEHVGSAGILIIALVVVAGLLLRTYWSHARRSTARNRSQS
jgi:membrane protein DedA with SNARE-associated domain